MSKLFVSKRTRAAAWVILLVLPALMVAFGYYHSHRPAVNPMGSRTFWDYIILNSDILLGLLFLLASAIPFILVFDKKKPQARELVPIAVMAAIGVVGRTVFEIIPLPNFKPCSAIIIITAVAFGPEAGFLTGALTAFVSNFIFGQGPWTPWQMFTWGLVGFLAGILQNAGVFAEKNRPHFTAKLWDRLCPANTNRGDLLHFVRQLTDHAPLRLCLYGFLSGFLYGWIMNLYFIIGYVSPLTWQTIGAAYLSSFFFDFCHGLCTFLVLWALGDPWVRKLERIKIKFGLTAEEVAGLRASYDPYLLYSRDPVLRRAVDQLKVGFRDGKQYEDLYQRLLHGADCPPDQYLLLADFASYCAAGERMERTYADPETWNRMSLHNIARSGIFAADRSIADYADTIWHVPYKKL